MLADLPVPERGGGGSPSHAASFQKFHDRRAYGPLPCLPAADQAPAHCSQGRRRGQAELPADGAQPFAWGQACGQGRDHPTARVTCRSWAAGEAPGAARRRCCCCCHLTEPLPRRVTVWVPHGAGCCVGSARTVGTGTSETPSARHACKSSQNGAPRPPPVAVHPWVSLPRGCRTRGCHGSPGRAPEPAFSGGGCDGESGAAPEQCRSRQDALYNPEPQRKPK